MSRIIPSPGGRILAWFALALAPNLDAQEKVTYDDQVYSLFEQSCLNCHNPDKAKGGLDLSSYAGAMKGSSGGKIAEVGDTGSKLLAVVMQTAEPKMPPEGDKLSGDKIAILKSWIEGGLLENQSSKARKPDKPKFDMAMTSDPAAKPEGPPPMPHHLLLEPVLVTDRAPAVHSLVSSPWAPLIAVTGQGQVLLFHSETRELVGVLPFPEGEPVSLAFTPNGRYLIVGGGVPGKSGTTVTFDVTTGERVLTAGKAFDTILACDLRPDLSTIATGSPARLIKLWNTQSGEQTASIKKHTDWVTALDFSPDGILLATGDRNGGVWVWESAGGNEFHTLRAHQAGITAAAFRADSNVLATASEDGTVRFWEMNNGGEIKKVDAHPGGVLAFSWARDGSFATAGRDGMAKIWKPDFNHLRDIGDLPDLPTALCLNAEGTLVFIATYDGQILVHRVETGERIGVLNANPPTIDARLVALHDRMEAHPREVEKATAAVGEARRQLEEIRGRVQETEQSLAQHREALSQAEQHLARTLDQQQVVDRETEAKRQQREDTILQGQALEHELAEAREAAANLGSVPDGNSLQPNEAEARVSELEARLSEVNRQSGALEAELASLEEKRSGFPGTVEAAKQAADALKASVSQSEKAVADRQSEAAKLTDLLKSQEDALAGMAGLREEMERQHRHWSAAAVNRDALLTAKAAEAAGRTSEEMTERFEGLQTAFDAAVAELNQARQDETANAETEEAALRDAGAKVTAFRPELEASLTEADRLRAKARELDGEYRRLLGPDGE